MTIRYRAIALLLGQNSLCDLPMRQPAILLTLTAPNTLKDLEANLAVLNDPQMFKQEIAHW